MKKYIRTSILAIFAIGAVAIIGCSKGQDPQQQPQPSYQEYTIELDEELYLYPLDYEVKQWVCTMRRNIGKS